MKKLFVVAAVLSAILANAQTGPTKEQTIDYLQKNYTRNIYQSASRKTDNSYLSVRGNISISPNFQNDFTVSFSWTDSVGSLMIVKEGTSDVKRISRRSVRFNMKNIESIDLNRNLLLDVFSLKDVESDGIWPYLITFSAVDDQNLIQYTDESGKTSMVSYIGVPFGNARVNGIESAVANAKELQLYKAVTHLRKLSGAKDPLRFDDPQKPPTKEETLAYIRENFKRYITQSMYFPGEQFTSFTGALTTAFTFGDDFSVHFILKDSAHNRYKREGKPIQEADDVGTADVQFNMKDIAAVKIKMYDRLDENGFYLNQAQGDGLWPVYISFWTRDNKHLIHLKRGEENHPVITNAVDIPFNNTLVSNAGSAENNARASHLFKALMHLQKLAAPPEIRFELP